ncbi:MAG: DUF1566 domain-containing protein [Lachnotalea sp.]
MKKITFVILSTIITVNLMGCSAGNANTPEEVVTDDTASNVADSKDYTYPIVDTNQGLCYNNSEIIEGPAEGEAFYGQDAQYTGNVPSYTDNGDGTVSDNVTGLMWAQDLSEASMSWEEAGEYCENLEFGGYDDWRLPTIKELWSIRDFSAGGPWVNTDYFYLVGNGAEGAQQHSWSSNAYLVDTDLAADTVAFAVNDWTGHIKSFTGNRFVRAVRGDTYGINDFVDEGDGTITDEATGLMWSQDDSGEGMNWEEALAYVENSEYAGYDDWRLPNINELQSIVDYSGVFPAIDPIFNITGIINEAGNDDYPYFWSSTSNPYIDPRDTAVEGYEFAWYVAFGYAVDHEGNDMHGAGSVRFDTKSEDGADGIDGERYYNYVRLVRGGDVTETPEGDPTTVNPDRVVVFEDGETNLPQNGQGGPQGGSNSSDQMGPGAPPQGESSSSEQMGPGGQNNSGQKQIDMAAAAEKLGVTEEVLIDALGEPGQGQPDFASAAETLGITETELMDALGTGK